uniref:Uncharacterized protein n=1 Tax=Trichuris muris TaxID=70415 RepID=A0A5S6QZ31_TRIMR
MGDHERCQRVSIVVWKTHNAPVDVPLFAGKVNKSSSGSMAQRSDPTAQLALQRSTKEDRCRRPRDHCRRLPSKPIIAPFSPLEAHLRMRSTPGLRLAAGALAQAAVTLKGLLAFAPRA